MQKIRFDDKLSLFEDRWSPRIISEANGQLFKLAKVEGEFVEHAHEHEDEVFVCIRGRFGLRLPETGETIVLEPGEMFVVPAGVRHAPFADPGTAIMIIEPGSTTHTGEVESERAVPVDEQPRI